MHPIKIELPTIIIFAIAVLLFGVVLFYIGTSIRKHQKILKTEKFSSKTKLRMLFSLLIGSRPIHEIVYTLFFLFFFTWLSLLQIAALTFNESKNGELITALVTAIATPILGFCGQVQFIRNETPGAMWTSIQDPFAKLIGGGMMALGYGGSIILLIYCLFLWLR